MTTRDLKTSIALTEAIAAELARAELTGDRAAILSAGRGLVTIRHFLTGLEADVDRATRQRPTTALPR